MFDWYSERSLVPLSLSFSTICMLPFFMLEAERDMGPAVVRRGQNKCLEASKLTWPIQETGMSMELLGLSDPGWKIPCAMNLLSLPSPISTDLHKRGFHISHWFLFSLTIIGSFIFIPHHFILIMITLPNLWYSFETSDKIYTCQWPDLTYFSPAVAGVCP